MAGDVINSGKDPASGRFTTGNHWWQVRSSHGRNPKFETADALEDACAQYFEWNDTNPLHKVQLVTFQGAATHEDVAVMRAMTVAALCMFIGVVHDTWIEWRKNRSDFSEVIAWAESVIFRQKFEGASADLLNANIIARDLGLADKVAVGGAADLPPVQVEAVTPMETARRIAFVLAQAMQDDKK